MRVRKNINCLSNEELHDLREAFTGIYQLPDSHSNSFATISGLHGNPGTSYCIHVNQGFLSWHRAYLLKIEDALRTIRCHTALPFWNWSSGNTTGVPEACKHSTYVDRNGITVANPLYGGPKPSSMGGGQTARASDIDSRTFGDLADDAQNALEENNWNDFVSQLNNVHGGVHVRIGGDMGSVPGAAFDPIFYLHHCNVDRLWHIWQQQNPVALPASEANAELEPFPRPFSNAWHLGIDFEHISDWDYSYRNWCFVFPGWDWVFERTLNVHLGDWTFNSRRIALVLKSSMMPKQSFNLRVFIGNDDADIKTKLTQNNGYAGTLSVFGMGDAKMNMRRKQEFNIGLNITKTLRKCVKKKDKDFSLKVVPVLENNQKIDLKKLVHLQLELDID